MGEESMATADAAVSPRAENAMERYIGIVMDDQNAITLVGIPLVIIILVRGGMVMRRMMTSRFFARLAFEPNIGHWSTAYAKSKTIN